MGLINGLGVAYAGVPPIIMTLGMNSAITGLLLIYTHGGFTSAPPQELIDFVNGNTITMSTQLLIWVARHDLRDDPAQLERLRPKLYAVGTNPLAAYLAGTNVRRILVVPYVISAIGAALTGVLLLGFLAQAFVNIGDEYLFSSAVAVAIGGASILGGRGHYIGTRRGSDHPHADRGEPPVAVARHGGRADLVRRDPAGHRLHRRPTAREEVTAWAA